MAVGRMRVEAPVHALRRKSPRGAEYYAMQSTSPATTKHPAEPPLLTPDEFRALVARREQKFNRASSLEQFATCTNVVSVGFGLLWWCWKHEPVIALFALCIVICNLIVTRLIERNLNKDGQELERLCWFVENTQDVGMLGFIIDLPLLTELPFGKLHRWDKARYDAIFRLFPSIRSQDAANFTTHQRATLCCLMFIPESTSAKVVNIGLKYCLPMLDLLEPIGGYHDLVDVKELLRREDITDEIREAAERCAEVVRERVAREEEKDLLLRPEHKPEVVETLLRPSEERQDTPPEQLLRATSDDDAEPPT